jgi:UDPglucose 6-dehydrogenase/UDP-N-acetyl-D-galactosamine dehydrogenase
MVSKPINETIVCVVGLGYVGTPLAEAFAGHVPTIGFDIDKRKVDALVASGSKIRATTDPTAIKDADFVLICVPTPVTKAKDPDLGPVRSATTTIGKNMKQNVIVVLESTVYPGVTEEIVIPILERESDLKCGKDFFVGYSPERINPNDDAHTLDKITKIVAGMDEKTTDRLVELYSHVTKVYRAPDIKTAEAAKVIENIQRDLNIALMNELAIIFDRLNIDTREVLKAAGTKWNFIPFVPGLVGGHCIPVDPYYLVARAQAFGYHPVVILAGRAINDSMPGYIARMTIKGLNEVGKVIKGSTVLIMGLTYKENVPDTRESPVEEMVTEFKEFGIDVYGHDPLLPDSIIEHFGIKPFRNYPVKPDAVVIAVAHDQFQNLTIDDILKNMNEKPVLIDVRGMIDRRAAENRGIYYQTL